MIKWILLVIGLIILMVPRRRSSLVIVTAHYNEDLEWLKKSKYQVVLCDKPGAKSSSFTPDKSCTLDVNKGQEASSYLKYIVENYDRLPDRIAFIHGHEETYHQKYPKHLLEAIDDARKDLDFVSLDNWIHLQVRNDRDFPDIKVHKNSHTPGTGHEQVVLIQDHWNFLKTFVKFDIMPQYLRYNGHAQFIVSRNAIYKHSKETYKKLLPFVIDTDNDVES